MIEKYGPPQLALGGLLAWVHGRKRPVANTSDGDDELDVIVFCGATGASVECQGPIVFADHLARFGEQCAALARGEVECVGFVSCEFEPWTPSFALELRTIVDGGVDVRVEISPDRSRQQHEFCFAVDRKHVGSLGNACAKLLASLAAG